MKTVLIIASAFLTSIPAHGFDNSEPDKDTIEVHIIEAVFNPGIKKITEGTSLEAILNDAGCHLESHLGRIRVTRVINGVVTRYIVAPIRKVDGNKEVFQIKNGDFIEVPYRLFDYEGRMKPVVVEGPFVLREVMEATGEQVGNTHNGQPASHPETEERDKPQSESKESSR